MDVRIDFKNIRGDMPAGQRGAFEALVCQLAHLQAPDPKSYRRIEGAGGDGGVECIHRAASGGIVGYQAKYYTSARDIDWQAREAMQHGFRQQEFRFVLSVVVGRANMARFIEQVKKDRDIDVMQWDPLDITDGPYLREGSWRTTWDRTQWQTDCWRTSQTIPIAFPISNYIWESHLDGSLTKGAHTFVPSPWLMVDLGLSLDIADVSICRDSSGTPQFVASNRRMDGSSAVIGAKMFSAYSIVIS
jgi:hypothetical protein